jgi:fatty-acyl-CoA synthase
MGRSTRRSAMNAWIRALDYTKILNEATGVTLCSILDGLADTHGDRPALLGEEEEFSFRDLAARANRYARWAMAEGLGGGDVVCLLMTNRPDYVAIWLGLTRAGCVVALLNTNLAADALLHSMRAAGSQRLIVGDALVSRIADLLPPGARVWVHGHAGHGDWPAIEPDLAHHDATPISASERSPPMPQDRALLIYTSGTSGLPKAANVTHARVLEWSFWFAGMMDAQPTDRLYDCLPMYHSTGGVVAIGAMLVKGGSVLIRPQVASGTMSSMAAARSSSTSASCAVTSSSARRMRRNGNIGCAWPAATGCRAMFGKPFKPASTFHGSSSSMLRQRAAYRCTTARRNPAPLGACRRSWPIAFLWRW